MTEFGTMNTIYRVEAIGFGLMQVSRAPKEGARDYFAGSSFQEGFVCDEVLAVPCSRVGSVLEDRKVAFVKDGVTIAVTSFADSRAYINFPWGTFEQGDLR
jgi:hypothetical protein